MAARLAKTSSFAHVRRDYTIVVAVCGVCVCGCVVKCHNNEASKGHQTLMLANFSARGSLKKKYRSGREREGFLRLGLFHSIFFKCLCARIEAARFLLTTRQSSPFATPLAATKICVHRCAEINYSRSLRDGGMNIFHTYTLDALHCSLSGSSLMIFYPV